MCRITKKTVLLWLTGLKTMCHWIPDVWIHTFSGKSWIEKSSGSTAAFLFDLMHESGFAILFRCTVL